MQLAASGTIHQPLLDDLNRLSFYHLPLNKPKSLGKEWVLKNVNPLLEKYRLSEVAVLSTFCEHVAMQVATSLNNQQPGKLLVTGGGTYNSFLIERIQSHIKHEVVIPDKNTIEFKEALIFAFLGALRMRNEINCLKSVTGAKHDNCGGAVYSCKL